MTGERPAVTLGLAIVESRRSDVRPAPPGVKSPPVPGYFTHEAEEVDTGSEAGSDDGGGCSTPQRSPVPAESAGLRDPAPGAGPDGEGNASGMESASFSGAGAASGEPGAAPGEAIDFRGQPSGDGPASVVEETGAGVLGAGIGNWGGMGPVEGAETIGLSRPKGNLSTGDGSHDRWSVNDVFNRPVSGSFQSNRQRFKSNRAGTARKCRVASPYQHVP